MEVYSIETGNLKLDGGAMFGVVPKVLWEKQYPADENNQCNCIMRCLLIVTDNRKILIDTGIGDKQTEKFTKHYHLNGDNTLKKSLQAQRTSFEDITDVILTHLHFDHSGGSTQYNEKGNLTTTFPNATYWIGKNQWELALNPNVREKASFFPENYFPILAKGQLRLVEKEELIIPGISVQFYNGHTVGQMIPIIDVNGRKLIFAADLLPMAAHIPMPWVMGYDTQPLETLEDKKRLYEFALKNNAVIFFEHDLYNECCTLHETDKGIRAKELFTLNSVFG